MQLIDSVHSLLGREVAGDYDTTLESHVRSILDHPEVAELRTETFLSIVARITGLYMLTQDRSALRTAALLQRAMLPFMARDDLGLDGACGLYETLHFLYVCNMATMAETKDFGPNVVAPFLGYVRRHLGPPRKLRCRPKPPPFRVVYLCRYAHSAPGNAVGGVMHDFLLGLATHKFDRYRPVLYAWLHHDDEMVSPIERAGIPVRRFPEMPMAKRVHAIEAALAEDGVDILVTDMNSPVPAAIFERRAAPVQVYLQLGLPYWPLSQIDHVMRVWEFEPAAAGFDPLICSTVNGPWDLASLAPPLDEVAVEAERDKMPKTPLLFGNYGRLAKITREYLEIMASLLETCPDIGIAVGGSGNADLIRAFAAERNLPPDRIRIHEGYVDGQVWGWLLDVFLDTFPFQGGASCREMIAKGRPVISTRSPDMPNLARERVPNLVATDGADYLGIATRLGTDDNALKAAREDTLDLLSGVPNSAIYADRLDAAFAKAIRARERKSSIGLNLRNGRRRIRSLLGQLYG